MATKIYLCLNEKDVVTDIMVTDYEMIHPERYKWTVADYTLIGKQFDRATETFSEPVKSPQTTFTKFKFRQRFTLAEMTGIYGAEDTDIVIKIFLDNLRVVEFIDTEDLATQNAMGYLYNEGYITYERMLEILG